MQAKNIINIILLFICISCSNTTCIECIHKTDPERKMEFCDDVELTYVDNQGELIPFDELGPYYENLGFDCK